jgi:hypothetical protein
MAESAFVRLLEPDDRDADKVVVIARRRRPSPARRRRAAERNRT